MMGYVHLSYFTVNITLRGGKSKQKSITKSKCLKGYKITL